MARTVFVKDPGHHLWIGINVWRRDITVRSQQMVDAGYKLARHALQFALRHLLRIAIHTTFGAAEGMFISAVFQVIASARDRISSSFTVGK